MSRPKGSKNKVKENKSVELPADYVSFNNVQIANADGTTTPLIPKKKRGRPSTKPNSIHKVEVKKSVVIEATGEEMPQLMKEAGVKLPLPETAYDGVKMDMTGHFDEPDLSSGTIQAKIAEAKDKIKANPGKFTNLKATTVEKKPTLSPFMLARQKAKGGGQ